MNRYELDSALTAYLSSVWDENDAEIAWDGLRYNKEIDKAFIRPTLKMNDAVQKEIGQNTSAVDEELGFYFIQVFSPIGDGKRKKQILSEKLRTYFRRVSPVNGVEVGNVSYQEKGIDPKDENFYFDIIKIEIINHICS